MKRWALFLDGEKQTEVLAPSADDALAWYAKRRRDLTDTSGLTAELVPEPEPKKPTEPTTE